MVTPFPGIDVTSQFPPMADALCRMFESPLPPCLRLGLAPGFELKPRPLSRMVRVSMPFSRAIRS